MGSESRQRGSENRQSGRDGEALFMNLARQWGEFEYTPNAVGTDGYLLWPKLMSNRLFVQVKSTKKREQQGDSLPFRDTPAQLREWHAYRPLLVRCVLEENRAWLKDSAEADCPPDPCFGKVFLVPLSQPVDATAKYR